MKKNLHSLIAAAVALCLAAPAMASAPSTAAELKKPQPDQLAKKSGGKKHKAPKKGGKA